MSGEGLFSVSGGILDKQGVVAMCGGYLEIAKAKENMVFTEGDLAKDEKVMASW